MNLLKKKDDEKVKKTVIWVFGDCRCCCSSGSDRICGILLLYTGLSGRFSKKIFDDDFDDYFSEEDQV